MCHVENVIQPHNPSPGFLAKQLASSFAFFLTVACDDHGQVRNPTKTPMLQLDLLQQEEHLIRHHEGLSVVIGVGLGNQEATKSLNEKLKEKS